MDGLQPRRRRLRRRSGLTLLSERVGLARQKRSLFTGGAEQRVHLRDLA